MEAGIKIIGSYCSNYSSSLHAQFHRKMYDIIAGWGTSPKVAYISDEMMQEWAGLIQTEVDINRVAQGSFDTKRIAELDKERDDLLSYLFTTISNAKRSPIAAQKTAAEKLSFEIKPYRGIQSSAYDKQTLEVDGLLHDLAKTENAAHIITLSLGQLVATLKTSNDAFHNLHTQRINDRADKLPSSKEIRPQTDALWQRITQFIEVAYLTTSTKKNKEAIGELAKQLNLHIADMKQKHKGSTTGSGGTTKDDPTPSTPSTESERADGE